MLGKTNTLLNELYADAREAKQDATRLHVLAQKVIEQTQSVCIESRMIIDGIRETIEEYKRLHPREHSLVDME